MDEYRIDTKELWYYILYPIIFVASIGTLFGVETLVAQCIQYFAPSTTTGIVHGLSIGLVLGIIPVTLALYKMAMGSKENPYVTFQFIGLIILATVLYIAVANLNSFFYPVYQSIGGATSALTAEESIVLKMTIKIPNDKQAVANATAVVKAAQAVVDTDLAALSKNVPNNSNPSYSDYALAMNYQTLLGAARLSGSQLTTKGVVIPANSFTYTAIMGLVNAAAAKVATPSGADVQKAFTDILALVRAQVTQEVAQGVLEGDQAALDAAKIAVPSDRDALNLANRRSDLYEPVTEGFIDGSEVDQTVKNVQQTTQALQKSLDTLSTATDDTCSVMKGIEKRFLDNTTAPDGEGEISPAEAKELKAQKLPGAQKQWKQKKQDWSDTHGQVSMVECFTDGSLSELVGANQQLSDLLASAPVQRVVAQVKQLQTSASFSQSYIDQLVANLNGESFENPDPTPEDTIAASTKLIAQANDVQASIRTILDSTKILKKNYVAIDAKSNDPNTVNNLAGTKV